MLIESKKNPLVFHYGCKICTYSHGEVHPEHSVYLTDVSEAEEDRAIKMVTEQVKKAFEAARIIVRQEG